MLEERISVLNAILPAQKDKLLKLQNEQRPEHQLSDQRKYLHEHALIIILIERFIQRVFVARIENASAAIFRRLLPALFTVAHASGTQ